MVITQMLEMVKEFIFAMGQPYLQKYDTFLWEAREEMFEEEYREYWDSFKKKDIVAMFDGLIDCYYIALGTFHTFSPNAFSGILEEARSRVSQHGITLELDRHFQKQIGMEDDGTFEKLLIEGFKEVHKSNMSKLGDDGKPIFNDIGKVMKGPNYSEPKLRPILRRYGVV